MTAEIRIDQSQLAWDETQGVVRAIMRDGHLMPISAIALGAVGGYFSSPLLGVAWALIMLTSTTVLWLACRRFARTPFDRTKVRSETRRVYIASFIQGVVTSSHILVFWTPGADQINLILLMIFMASAMFAVSLTATSRPILLTNIALYTIIAEIVCLTEGGAYFQTISLLAPIYFAVLAGGGMSTYTRAREMLILAQERETIISDLRRANEAKSSFLANMSHELRTPLNAIIGFSEMMKEEAFGPHAAPKYREYAADIHASGAHLLDLVCDILDSARVDGGRYIPADERFATKGLFATCERMFAQRASEKGIAFTTDISFQPELMGDARAIKQILINLLTNAVKFTPKGGQVVLGSRRAEHGALSITVRDSGQGIHPDDLPNIFSKFGQGRHDVAVDERGVGLGLAIVKGLVESHDGRVDVESAPGRGTLMTVTLPASRVIDAAAADSDRQAA